MELIGGSPTFKSVVDLVKRVARHDASVLIEGETGTGKEMVARAVHYSGARSSGPFVPVNCGAIPDTLFESELFGHRKGAFTDARSDREGLIRLAHSGTLFLDEVDSLSPRAQVALLRFLQDHTYRPVGGGEETRADVRVIAACNRDLEALGRDGIFRADLMYRLKVLWIPLPPLRERGRDVYLLTTHFLDDCTRRYRMPPRRLEPARHAWFEHYAWPGNVRELENLVNRAALLCDGEDIVIHPPSGPVPRQVPGLPPDSLPVRYSVARAEALARFHRSFLSNALQSAQGNVSEAARLSDTDRRSFGRLLKKYGIAPAPYRI